LKSSVTVWILAEVPPVHRRDGCLLLRERRRSRIGFRAGGEWCNRVRDREPPKRQTGIRRCRSYEMQDHALTLHVHSVNESGGWRLFGYLQYKEPWQAAPRLGRNSGHVAPVVLGEVTVPPVPVPPVADSTPPVPPVVLGEVTVPPVPAPPVVPSVVDEPPRPPSSLVPPGRELCVVPPDEPAEPSPLAVDPPRSPACSFSELSVEPPQASNRQAARETSECATTVP
jgi:hypothetical protein